MRRSARRASASSGCSQGRRHEITPYTSKPPSRNRGRGCPMSSGSDFQFLQLEYRAGCATVWLNRPERHNAFHEGLLAELPRCLALLSQQESVRAIVLAGRGRSFCAGADLGWMQQQAVADYEANLEDARR